MRGKYQERKERSSVDRDRDVILNAHLRALEEMLKGDGRQQPGLIKKVEDMENYIRDERTTRRVLVIVFGFILTVASSVGAWTMNKLADAVLNRPVVVAPTRTP
jgi:hypothetical protein